MCPETVRFFSFVFVDELGEIKYACRDKFGVKPLFFYKKNNTIAFASEPNILIELFPTAPNPVAVEEYHAFRAPILQGSFYHGVEQVDPGSCYVTGQYFSVEAELAASRETKLASAVDAVDVALRRGVQTRCVSDAPVALLLSKGVDSNLIRFSSSVERLYTIGFDGDEDIDEHEDDQQ